MALYRQTMRESGHDEEAIARCVAACWVWRNVFVAETDAEAERIALPAFAAMQEHRAAMRKRVEAEQGVTLAPLHAGPAARTDPQHALIHGSPATVAERLAEVAAIGVGGVIMSCRMGPMPHEAAVQSLTLLMERVAPQFRGADQGAAPGGI
jgi:alkanesulfonate monooxygenase SsuD/methylene tetrahydromethanopterin reductase-like flavin-dependent oxidoreductase (luciferase family)